MIIWWKIQYKIKLFRLKNNKVEIEEKEIVNNMINMSDKILIL